MINAIEIKNLGKKYRIGLKPQYYSLRDSLSYFFGNPLSFLKPRKRISDELFEDEFWALKDITFNVRQGESIGIIGNNGAGKSTLLKILSRITPPTCGEIRLFGRVSSLLEVGTGFHPELTGRENIFLNGAILGMKRQEIVKKFDEIVNFSEIEKFIDTPVKFYSSGMYTRLAFAIAAFLDPEILIIDEVLAVGDSQFQKKCFGRINDIARSGRTILFVSHNLAAIVRLMDKCILLEAGRLIKYGNPKDVVDTYLKKFISGEGKIIFPEDISKYAQIISITLRNTHNETTSIFDPGEKILIIVEFVIRNKKIGKIDVTTSISLADGTIIWIWSTREDEKISSNWRNGKYKINIVFPEKILNCGNYVVRAAVGIDAKAYDNHPNFGKGVNLEVSEASNNAILDYNLKKKEGYIAVIPEYSLVKLD